MEMLVQVESHLPDFGVLSDHLLIQHNTNCQNVVDLRFKLTCVIGNVVIIRDVVDVIQTFSEC